MFLTIFESFLILPGPLLMLNYGFNVDKIVINYIVFVVYDIIEN